MTEGPFNPAFVPLDLGTTRIEASAGTGKTYTLTALYLRLIAEEGLEIGEILVTTFTIPALAELRERIRLRLRDALAMFAEDLAGGDPLLDALYPIYRARAEEIRPRLETALQRFDEAAIFTIHGFCQRLLQERAFESGVAFDAELLTDQSPLLREVADDFWRTHLYPAAGHLGAFALLDKTDAAGLAKLLGTVIARPTMAILPEWETDALPRAEAGLTAALDEIRTIWRADGDSIRAIFDCADSWAIKDMKKPEVCRRQLAGLARCLEDETAPIADYRALDFFTEESVAEQTSKKAGNPRTHALFTACSRLGEARATWLLALRREFLEWAPGALAQSKLQRNVLSFDDLLSQLREALRDDRGSMVVAVQKRYSVALVDEFQDTDPVQAEIFERLFDGHGRLYFIGDPKQAIYGFRGADVFSYLAAVEHSNHRQELSANQRSVTPLVSAVNAIFQRGPRPFVIEGIDFHPAHAAGRADGDTVIKEPPFKFWLWSEDKPVPVKTAEARIPGVVADAIIEQIAASAGQLGPQNFAVLTANNDQARMIHEALTTAGLPAVVLSSKSVFRSLDAVELLAILQALATPTRDDRLRAALATSILGWDAAALEALGNDGPAWERVLERFAQHHAQWLTAGFFPTFRHLLVDWEVRPRLLAQLDGERRMTNLLHLGELLHEAAATQRLGPAGVVQWLATQLHPDTRTAVEHEQRLESDADAVKVVTVHKSKGLEFDIVWCPFSWGKAALRKEELITFHAPATGELTLDLGSPDLAAHRDYAERERLAEQTRLLYVALTRAKWQCHFVAGVFKDCENSAAAWVLHPPVSEDGAEVAALEARSLDPTILSKTVEELTTEAPDAFAHVDLPAPVHRKFTPAATSEVARTARVFDGHIPRDWAIGSFSSLIAGESAERPDHDRDFATPAPAIEPTGIHAFPRGRRAGTCLHEIFERLDFRDDSAIESMVARKLGVFGFDRPDFRLSVADCVRQVLTVELETGLRLADVAMASRLNEVEFHLPAGRLTPARVRQVLGEELSFSDFTGFLKGFIDLIFEHEGRFYIVDWKSNWLGAEAGDYTTTAMQAEIARHHYGLQYHLYVVALHRLLAQRLPDYDYDRHFGGVFYLFLRGVEADHPELGVFRDRPPLERTQALDELFHRES